MKKIIFLLALITFFIPISSVLGAGKAYIKIGESFKAQIDERNLDRVEWTVLQDQEILEKKEGKRFEYLFTDLGEYQINILATEKNGHKKTSILYINVGESTPNFQKPEAIISALPQPNEKGVIFLTGQEQKVVFSFNQSKGDIERYEFEANIFEDSNGDGVIDNDVDNQNSSSYNTGGSFVYTYKNNGIPAKAKLTTYTKEGQILQDTIQVRFDDNIDANDNSSKELKALIQTIPPADENGNIYLLGEEGEIVVVSQSSEGKIDQYRIDENIFIDSNNDGKKDNDIDNISDDSFLDGQPYIINVKKQDNEDQVIKLTVVDENNMGSSTGRRVVFKDASEFSYSGEVLKPVLTSSRSNIFLDEVVQFRVFNIPSDASVWWDFDSDGSFEIEDSNAQQVDWRFSGLGEKKVTALLKTSQSEISLDKIITVQKAEDGETASVDPTALFVVQKEGNKVFFDSSGSYADSSLANQSLSYEWDFGDAYKTTGPNPTHIYESVGEYIVLLKVEDAIERTSTFSSIVTVENIIAEFDDQQHGGKENLEKIPDQTTTPEPLPEKPEGEDPQISDQNPLETPLQNTENDPLNKTQKKPVSFSFPWWIFLILLIPAIPIAYLVKEKIADPDKDFSVIIKDFLLKIENRKTNKSEISAENEIEIVDESETKEEKINNSEIKTDTTTSKEDENSSDNPSENTPDWMRNYDDSDHLDDNVSDESLDDDTVNTDNQPLALPDNTTETISSQESFDSGSIDSLEEKKDSITQETPDFLNSDHLSLGNTDTDRSSNTSVTENFLDSDTIDSPLSDSIDESDATVHTSESPFSGEDHPDWLQDIKTPESPNEMAPLEGSDGSVPDWLKTDSVVDVDSENSEPDNDTPDWLKTGYSTQAVDELDDTNEEKDIVSEENISDKAPDWLQDNSSEEMLSNDNDNTQPNVDDTPDWLKNNDDLDVTQAKDTYSDQEDEEEKVPDWLKTDAVVDIDSGSSDSDADTPDWLKTDYSDEGSDMAISSDYQSDPKGVDADNATALESESNTLDQNQDKEVVIPSSDAVIPKIDQKNTKDVPDWLK